MKVFCFAELPVVKILGDFAESELTSRNFTYFNELKCVAFLFMRELGLIPLI
jgi:hypothetical protein